METNLIKQAIINGLSVIIDEEIMKFSYATKYERRKIVVKIISASTLPLQHLKEEE